MGVIQMSFYLLIYNVYDNDISVEYTDIIGSIIVI